MAEHAVADDEYVWPDRPVPRPIDWAVECPACGLAVGVDMIEQIDGCTYQSGDSFGDPFVACKCGATFEPSGVRVSEVGAGGRETP